jgi:hypothetical protein
MSDLSTQSSSRKRWSSPVFDYRDGSEEEDDYPERKKRERKPRPCLLRRKSCCEPMFSSGKPRAGSSTAPVSRGPHLTPAQRVLRDIAPPHCKIAELYIHQFEEVLNHVSETLNSDELLFKTVFILQRLMNCACEHVIFRLITKDDGTKVWNMEDRKEGRDIDPERPEKVLISGACELEDKERVGSDKRLRHVENRRRFLLAFNTPDPDEISRAESVKTMVPYYGMDEFGGGRCCCSDCESCQRWCCKTPECQRILSEKRGMTPK